jgi:hypothetical protein
MAERADGPLRVEPQGGESAGLWPAGEFRARSSR